MDQNAQPNGLSLTFDPMAGVYGTLIVVGLLLAAWYFSKD